MRKNRFFAIALALMMLLQAAPINAFAALGGESAPAVETVEEAPLVTVEAETKDVEPAPAEKKEEKVEDAIPVEFDYGTLHAEVVGPDGEPLNGTLGLRDEDGRSALVAIASSFELDVRYITKWSPAMARFTEVAKDGDTCSVYLYEETAEIKGAGKEAKAKTVYTPLDLPLELVCTCEYEEVTDETGAVTKLVRHFTLAPDDKSLLDDDGTLIVRYAELETQFVDLPVEVVDENGELLEGALFGLCDDDGTDPDAGKPAVFAEWDEPQFEIPAADFVWPHDRMVGRPWENGETFSLYLWEREAPVFYDGPTERPEIVCTCTQETEENDDGVVTKIVRRLALSCAAAAEDGVLRIRHTPSDDARLNIIFHTEEQKPRIENTWSIMMVIEGPNGYHRTLFDVKAVANEQPTKFDTTLYPLEPGEYTITVLGAETPHVSWETTTFTFTVEPGENEYEIVLTRDESLPRYEDALTVYKGEIIASEMEMEREANIKLLPGAEFGLYTVENEKTGEIGELIATYVTDENGRLVIRTDDAALKDDLPDPWREGESWYVLREDKAPAGYLNTGLEYDVFIQSNGDGLYTIVYGIQRTTQVTPVKLGETAGTQAETAVRPIVIEPNDHMLWIRNLPAEENVGNLRLNVSITFPADVTINGLHEDRRVEKVPILIDGPAGYGRKIVELNWADFTKAEDANVYTYSGLLEGVPAGDYAIDAGALEVPGFRRTVEVTVEPENPRGGAHVNAGETATATVDIEYVKDVKSINYYGLHTVIFDSQTGEGLTGSEFTIYDAEGNELGVYTVNEGYYEELSGQFDEKENGWKFIPCDPNDENTPQWILEAFNALDLDSGRREFYVGPFTLKQTKTLEGYFPSVKEYKCWLILTITDRDGEAVKPDRPRETRSLEAAEVKGGMDVSKDDDEKARWIFRYSFARADSLELDENGKPTSDVKPIAEVLIPNTRVDSVGQLQIVKRVRVSDDRSGKVTFPGAPEGMTFTVTGPETFAPVTITLADFGEPVEKQDMVTVIDEDTGEEVEVPMGEPYLEYTYTLEVPYGRYYVTEDPESAQVEGYILYTRISYDRAVIKDDGVGKEDAGTAAEVKGGLDFSKDDGARPLFEDGIPVNERNDGPSYAYVNNNYSYEIRYNTLPVRKIDGSTDKLVILPGAGFGLYTGKYVIDPETGKETFVQGELIKTYVSDEKGFFIIDTADPDLAPYLPTELSTGRLDDEAGHVRLYLIEITTPEGYLPSTMVYPVDIWFRIPAEPGIITVKQSLNDGAVLMGAPQTETKVTPQPSVPPEEEATKEAPFKYEYRIDSPDRGRYYLDVPNTPDAWGSLKLVKTVRILDNKTQKTGTAIENDRISQITEHLGETRFNISGPNAFGENGRKIVTLAEFGEPAMSTETLSDGRVVTVYTFTKTLSVPVGEYLVWEEYAPTAPAVTRVTSISYGEPVVNNPQAVGGGAALQSVNGEVAETRAETGFIVIKDFARVVKFGTTQVNIENTYTNRLHEIRYEGMTVNKVDADNGKVLPGATFAIYDADGNEVHRFVSGEEPYVIDPQAEWLAPYLPNEPYNPEALYFDDDPAPGYVTFTVKELEAPEGYIKSEMEYTLTLMLTQEGWNEPGQYSKRSLEPVAETKAEKEIGDLKPIKEYDWYDLVYRIYYGLPGGVANNSLTVGNTQIGKEAANGKLILTKRIRVVGDEEMQAFPATPPDIVFTVSGGPNYFADVTVKLSDFEGPATVTEVIEAMSGRPREEITYEVYTLELDVPVGRYTVTENRASAQVPGFQLSVDYRAMSPEDALDPVFPGPGEHEQPVFPGPGDDAIIKDGAADTLKSAVKALTGNVAMITAGTLMEGHDEPIIRDGAVVRVTDITDEEDALIPSRVIITDTYTNRIDKVNHSAVTVNKVDENGDDLTGATFTLYYGDTAIMTFQGGEFEISTALEQLKDYLPAVPGEDGVVELTLKETAAPEGYVLSEKEYPIFIRLDTVVEHMIHKPGTAGTRVQRISLKTLFGNVAALTSGTLATIVDPGPGIPIEHWILTYAIWTLDEAGEQTQELEIANEPVPTEPRYGLVVRWTAEGADIPENGFVTVTGPDGFEQKIYYSEFDGDEYRLQLPAGVYTVTENEPSAQVENYELTVTVKPAASVELGAAKGEAAEAEATDPVIHVHNVYQRLYELVITLTGIGADIPENAYVTVTGPDGFEQIIYYYEFDETGTYTLEVPAGEYFVTENRPSAKVNGHSLTISGDNGTPVTVGENGGRADIENEYGKNSGGDPTPRPDPVEPTNPPTPVLNTDDHYAYIIGYPDGTVRPEGTITRAETVTIFFRMLTDESRAAVWSTTNPFTDVKAADWFNNAISTMSNAGIVNGYPDGSFNPNGNITRAEFAAMAIRFFQDAKVGPSRFSDTIGHWAEEAINKAQAQGLITGYPDGTFRPDEPITRAEAMTIMNRVLKRAPHKDHLLSERYMITFTDNMDTTKWYYADVQEATNSHTYRMSGGYEEWEEILPIRDWAAFETMWSNANSAKNPGEVIGN